MAFLEAAIQCLEDRVPVLLVTQEMAAPQALQFTCPSKQPYSAAFLLTPSGYNENPLCAIKFEVDTGVVNWPDLPNGLLAVLEGNLGAKLLPLLAAIATEIKAGKSTSFLEFPLSPNTHLELSLR